MEKAENEIKRFRFLTWLDSVLQTWETKSNITIVIEEDIEEPQNNYEMNEEFLEDQIEGNKKEAASIEISFSQSNDNLNSTLKSLPKENKQKKEINFKNWIFKWYW